MKVYSYIVAVDSGFAPNPFHGICTVACCKPDIRRDAEVGDYVVGLAGYRYRQQRGNQHTIIYAMRVSEAMTFEQYWADPRFRAKRPDRSAGGKESVGDNIYHRDGAARGWIQEDSEHCSSDIPHDTEINRVLASVDFIYWGQEGPRLPDDLQHLIVGRKHRCRFSQEEIDAFVAWFNVQERGRVGMPMEPLPAPL